MQKKGIDISMRNILSTLRVVLIISKLIPLEFKIIKFKFFIVVSRPFKRELTSFVRPNIESVPSILFGNMTKLDF